MLAHFAPQRLATRWEPDRHIEATTLALDVAGGTDTSYYEVLARVIDRDTAVQRPAAPTTSTPPSHSPRDGSPPSKPTSSTSRLCTCRRRRSPAPKPDSGDQLLRPPRAIKRACASEAPGAVERIASDAVQLSVDGRLAVSAVTSDGSSARRYKITKRLVCDEEDEDAEKQAHDNPHRMVTGSRK